MPQGRSSYKRRGRSVPLRARVIDLDPAGCGEVQVGSVVIHQDNRGEHIAILLDLDAQYAMALFFSSVAYGLCSREAALEELALAGFVYTKQTFLCLVHRQANEFYPHQGLEFPAHRVQALRKEFGIDREAISGVRPLQP